MEEILVITACLYQKGCNESASTLYSQRPQLQAFASRTETEIKKTTGPIVTDYIVPMIIFAHGATGIMRLSNHIDLKYKKSNIELIFKKNF